jgi:hypothetical protein
MMNSLLCAAGRHAQYGSEEEMMKARELLEEMPRMVLGKDGMKRRVTKAPNAIEDFHDLKTVSSCLSLNDRFCYPEDGERIMLTSEIYEQIFSDNLPKLLELKRRYDPRNRLKGPFNSLIQA